MGKNPEKRTEPETKKLNATTFRIANNGKFPAEIQFALMSTIKDNDPEFKKGVFFIEPETMTIPPSDLPQELTVWAIPSAGKFSGEATLSLFLEFCLSFEVP